MVENKVILLESTYEFNVLKNPTSLLFAEPTKLPIATRQFENSELRVNKLRRYCYPNFEWPNSSGMEEVAGIGICLKSVIMSKFMQ